MRNLQILVPTDLSDLGNRAFAAAEEYRRINGGVITPLHALNEPVWPEGIRLPSVDDKASAELKRFASRKCLEAAHKYTDVEFVNEPYISYGDPARVITEKAVQHDIVILSTHGRTGFRQFVLGSVAKKVCRNSHVPVMVTAPRDKIGPFNRVLLSTDFSEASAGAFGQARFLMEHTEATFELLHIVSLEYASHVVDHERIKKEAEQKLSTFTQKYFGRDSQRIDQKVVLSPDSVHRALNKHISDGPFDLVLISTAGKTGLDNVLMGSTTSHIVQVARVPVLTVRPV